MVASYLQVVHKLLHLHLGLMHTCHIFEAHAFTRLAIHDGKLGHFQLILNEMKVKQVQGQGSERERNGFSCTLLGCFFQMLQICSQVWTHKSTEATISATHTSESKDVPEYRHADGRHPQSVERTAGVADKKNSVKWL